MSTTLNVLDGHMIDYLVEGADDSLLEALGIDPSCEYLTVERTEWYQLYSRCCDLNHRPVVGVGGAGVNTARWFARLGGTAQVHGQVGRDDRGTMLINSLTREGLQSLIRQVGGRTGIALIFVRPKGRRVMRSDEACGVNFDSFSTLKAQIQPGTWLHLTGYLLNPASPINQVAWKAMDLAVARGVPISIDLGSAVYFGVEAVRYVVERYATVMFLNSQEARKIGLRSAKKAATTLREWAGPERQAVVAVTRGARGVVVASASESHEVSAKRVKVRDTTGAGDAFAGGFLHAWLDGQSLKAAAECGSAAAAATVQVLGSLPPR